MSLDSRSDVGAMFRKTGELLRGNLSLAITAIVLLTLVDVVQDASSRSVPGLAGGALIASLVLQYQVTLRLLVQEGLAERGARGRFWALLGLNLLSGAGILLGLVLLIVPGVYLLVRWSVAAPVLLGENAGIVDSIRRSGEEIDGRFWPVFGFGLVFGCGFVLGAGILGTGDGLVPSIAGHGIVDAALVAAWHGAVAIYAVGRGHQRVAEIFA